jgi:Na+/H+ antiporter NhaC
MTNRLVYTFFLFCILVANLFAQETTDTISSTSPVPETPISQANIGENYTVEMATIDGKSFLLFNNLTDGLPLNFIDSIELNNEKVALVFNDDQARHPYTVDEKGKLVLIKTRGEQGGYRLHHLAKISPAGFRNQPIPLWLSLLPPLVAIGLALIFREVIVSLFIGVWAGAFVANGMRPGALLMNFLEVVEKYVINALADSAHMSIIIFSLLIGGMVAIISRNGGMAGVVLSLSRYARGPRSAQAITWLLGVAIFFDDYANTLIVGNTMRSVTDKFRISREKLAYIVDSTAAPVASVAFITTWIGAELGYIEAGTAQIDNFDQSLSAYSIFISSLKYSFYPILTLAFILMIIYFQKDYGQMLKAEKRARSTGQVSPASTTDEDEPNMEDLTPVKGAQLRWYNAGIPVLVVILMTIYGLIHTGMSGLYGSIQEAGIAVPSSSWGDVWRALPALLGEDTSTVVKIGQLIGSADSYVALLWASLSGVVAAIILTLGGRIMSLFDTMHTLVTGFKTMMPALVILTLAWSLAQCTEELYTANYLTSILAGNVSPYAIPAIVFVLSALISFSTGSSWSTMAILYPIAIPTIWSVAQAQGLDMETTKELLFNVISIVLAASVLGDHCSPISDTTILSSLASDCNHIDHVRTQMPYALTVGVVSLIMGTLSTYLGGGFLICFTLLLVGLAILGLVVTRVGKRI